MTKAAAKKNNKKKHTSTIVQDASEETKTTEPMKARQATEAAEATEAAAAEAAEDWDYEESEEERARTTFLYVPVEGDIQVLPRSIGTLQQILQWPYTEGHGLLNQRLVHEPYRLTGFIRSFDFFGPINKRYSRIYGQGTAEIRGPAVIFNENHRQSVSLTKEDIPRISTQFSQT